MIIIKLIVHLLYLRFTCVYHLVTVILKCSFSRITGRIYITVMTLTPVVMSATNLLGRYQGLSSFD